MYAPNQSAYLLAEAIRACAGTIGAPPPGPHSKPGRTPCSCTSRSSACSIQRPFAADGAIEAGSTPRCSGGRTTAACSQYPHTCGADSTAGARHVAGSSGSAPSGLGGRQARPGDRHSEIASGPIPCDVEGEEDQVGADGRAGDREQRCEQPEG